MGKEKTKTNIDRKDKVQDVGTDKQTLSSKQRADRRADQLNKMPANVRNQLKKKIEAHRNSMLKKMGAMRGFLAMKSIFGKPNNKNVLLATISGEPRFSARLQRARVVFALNKKDSMVAKIQLLKDGTIDVSTIYAADGESFTAKSMPEVLVKLEQIWRKQGGVPGAKLEVNLEKIGTGRMTVDKFYRLAQEKRLKFVTGLDRERLKEGVKGKINLPTHDLESEIGAQMVFPEEVRQITVNGVRGYRKGSLGNFYTESGRYLAIYNGDQFGVDKVLSQQEMKELMIQMRRRKKVLMDELGMRKEKVKGKEQLVFKPNSWAEKFVKHLEKTGLKRERAMEELVMISEVARNNAIDPKLLIALRQSGTIPGQLPRSEYIHYGRYVANAMQIYRGHYVKKAKSEKVNISEKISSGDFGHSGKFTADFLYFALARLNLFNSRYVTNNTMKMQETFKFYGLKFDKNQYETLNKKVAKYDIKRSSQSIQVPIEEAKKYPQMAKRIVHAVKWAIDNQITAAHCWDWCWKIYRKAGVPLPHGGGRFWRYVQDAFRGSEYPGAKGETFLPLNKLNHIQPGDWIYYKNYWRGWPDNYNPPYVNGNHSVIFLGWQDQARGIAKVAGHSNGRCRAHLVDLTRETNGRRHSKVTWVQRPRHTLATYSLMEKNRT